MFMIGALIVAIAATAITIKTLVGYIELRLSIKIIASLVVVFSWFAPVIIGGLRASSFGNSSAFAYISNIGYFLFGAAFILLVLLLFRDFIWFLIYELAKVFKYAQANVFNPSDYHKLNIANVYTLGLTLILSIYACDEALKVPSVKEVIISSAKLRQKYTIVQLSDVHVNRTTSIAHLQKLVDKVNSLNPDLILLTGDIGDDKVAKVEPQMAVLKGLKSKYGEYIVYGSLKTFGGTMVDNNGIVSIENTATIDTWYRPDIKADCRLYMLDDGSTYELMGDPENINRRNQFLKLKVKRVGGRNG